MSTTENANTVVAADLTSKASEETLAAVGHKHAIGVDQELEQLRPAYERHGFSATTSRLRFGFAVALSVITIAVVGIIGILRMTGRIPPVGTKVESAMPPLRVVAVVGETAVLFEDAGQIPPSITVAETTTNTVRIQNTLQGQFALSALSLSPHLDRLAHIQSENNLRSVNVITTTNSVSVTLSGQDLTDSNGGIPLTPCDWTSIVWSPNGLRFAFFGCSSDLSAVVIVEGTDKLTPIVLKQTVASSLARQVFWLDDDSLLYTTFDAKTEQAWVHRLGATQTSVPLLVYQR